jgi:hypothetical protein
MILGWPENIFYNKKRWELRDKQLNMKTRQPKCSNKIYSQSSCRYVSPFAEPTAILILVDQLMVGFPFPDM